MPFLNNNFHVLNKNYLVAQQTFKIKQNFKINARIFVINVEFWILMQFVLDVEIGFKTT